MKNCALFRVEIVEGLDTQDCAVIEALDDDSFGRLPVERMTSFSLLFWSCVCLCISVKGESQQSN